MYSGRISVIMKHVDAWAGRKKEEACKSVCRNEINYEFYNDMADCFCNMYYN